MPGHRPARRERRSGLRVPGARTASARTGVSAGVLTATLSSTGALPRRGRSMWNGFSTTM
ncbi:hypothetical protein ACFQY7_13170 [Actinomadura luteofluorescens]|uniref:hypothetical protein n=1 Tax=Actinomadura luteofluorescens TaxID=46163 RepID=UPI00362598D4